MSGPTLQQAREHGIQSAALDLPRSANPFDSDGEGRAHWEAWDSGYSEEIASWRAARRAEIADDFGDAAADEF
jgi:hypothetical protein